MSQIPTGTVTLLFTDIEGSTLLLQQLGERYADMLATCRQLLRTAFQQWNGFEVDTQGDAFFVVFARASNAVSAVVDMQRALARHDWPSGAAEAMRIGLHTGEPTRTAEGYVGLDVHHAARIMSVGHGGQVLLSQTIRELVKHNLPDEVSLRDLGEHRLKDLQLPGHIYQLIIADLPADFPLLKTLDSRPNNLPVQLTQFIGREKEITAVQYFFQREDARLMTLTGPGGTGKTRLGLQVAAELSDLFPDGVYFVNLAPISDPTLVVTAIAQTLDLKEMGDQTLLVLLKGYLRDKHILLLLDNFEQVASAALQVVDLLATCPKLKVIVTSRTVLHVRGDQEFPVPPLAVPDPKHLPDLVALSHYEAVELFVSRAQAVKPEFQLSNTNAPAIVEICARLDGLPLAIELAAARIKLLPPQALLARLGQRFAVLTSGPHDAPARQQTLRNTIAWSYNLLEAQEQRLFRRLSVFVGGCTLEAIEAVCTTLDTESASWQVLDGVASLIDKSLLQQTEQESNELRLVMFETIREHGLERLAESGETEAMQEAHALYYLALAEQAEPHLKGAEQGQWFARLEQERDNLRVALTWLLEAAARGRGEEKGKQQAERALRLGVALYWFWYTAGPPSEGRSFLERALSVVAVVATPLRSRALFATSDLVWAMGDLDRAQTLAEESLRLCQELRDTGGIANALMMLQGVAWLRNQYALARSYLEEAEALFREVGDTWSRGQCLTQLAQISTAQGEYVRARTLLEESRGLYSTLGDQRRLSFVLYLLARVLFLSQGDLAEAQALAEQSLALLREFKETWITHQALYLLGQMHVHQGELGLARELFEASLATGKETQWDQWTTVMAQIGLARVLALQGEGEVARALYQESLALLHKIGDKESIAACLEGLGAVGAVQGQPAWAARLLGAAEALRQHIGAPLPPVYRNDYEQAVTAARSALGEKAFASAWAEGRIMTPEQALAAEGQPLLPMQTPLAKSAATSPDGLTAREVEVLRLLAQGLTDAQIAEHLVLSLHTVHAHLRTIYSKLGVTSRSAATRYAFEHQLV
jgi:predicted ATPase/class 3 adenylate cyclase/DNA-binding CsgD family transcriptional regulator